MVGRDAVDQQRADAHLLEPPGRAPEQVALGPAPVLAEDAAQPVPAAPEAEPHREAAVDQDLHALEREVADQRHRLQQHEVGRLVLEDAGEQLEALEALLVGHVAVQAEGHGAVATAALLAGCLPREADAPAREFHPVGGRLARRAAQRGQVALDAPGVGGDDVAAHVHVRAVHAHHGLGRIQQRPRAPHRVVGELVAGGLEPLELGGDPAVEHNALLLGNQLLHAAVRGRDPPAWSGGPRGGHRA